jgi:hypothetical protein
MTICEPCGRRLALFGCRLHARCMRPRSGSILRPALAINRYRLHEQGSSSARGGVRSDGAETLGWPDSGSSRGLRCGVHSGSGSQRHHILGIARQPQCGLCHEPRHPTRRPQHDAEHRAHAGRTGPCHSEGAHIPCGEGACNIEADRRHKQRGSGQSERRSPHSGHAHGAEEPQPRGRRTPSGSRGSDVPLTECTT